MQKRTPLASAFDLNLLGIFEEVYKFGSVTKAASALKLTPSSISQSLQKLRAFFSDPLFVRTGARLTATTMAETIHLQISREYGSLLERLEDLATAATKDILIIHCTTYLSLRVIPVITQWIEENAPGCRVIHRDFMRQQDTSEDLLLQRGVDLVFDLLPAYNFSLYTKPIMAEEGTFICRRSHPRLGSHISMEEAKLEKFALYESNGMDVRLSQIQINMELGERNFALVSGSLLTIATTVAVTDIVGAVPVWMYEQFRHIYDIRALESDVRLDAFPIYMMYSKTSLQNTLFKKLAVWLESDFRPATPSMIVSTPHN